MKSSESYTLNCQLLREYFLSKADAAYLGRQAAICDAYVDAGKLSSCQRQLMTQWRLSLPCQPRCWPFRNKHETAG